jgi:hypothetical protein
MGVTEPHPEGDRDLPVTHTYNHPDGAGFGEHHASPDERALDDRLAHPNTPPDWPRSTLTMTDLDLAPGTELSHVATDEDTGNLIFAWTDKQGDHRRTAFTPQQAGRFLTGAAGDTSATGTEGKTS